MRRHIASQCVEPILGGPGEVVEVDETLLTSVRDADTQKRKRALIFGITDRDKVFTTIIPSRRQRSLLGLVKQHVAPGSIIHTDGWPGYEKLADLGYEHRSVNHKRAEWVGRDGTSTLFIDNYWAYLKRFIRGTHLHIGERYLELYIKESEYRFNYRRRPATMFWNLLNSHPLLHSFSGAIKAPVRRSKAGGNLGGPLQVLPTDSSLL